MAWIIVGLGNPGDEYEHTRHNAGRMAVEDCARAHALSEWEFDKNMRALVAKGLIQGTAVVCVLPETFMNKSGSAVGHVVKSLKAAERCVVLYDDLDMPLGNVKMSFNRGSGGHKGVESIARALKTKAFWRIRIGISPATASGKLKKPKGEEEVLEFILKTFKPSELAILKKVYAKTTEALAAVVTDGPMHAMQALNTAK